MKNSNRNAFNKVAVAMELNNLETRKAVKRMLSISKAVKKEGQLKHLNEHREKFIDIWKRTPQQYMSEYSYIEDLYENLCSDLGIKPKATLIGD